MIAARREAAPGLSARRPCAPAGVGRTRSPTRPPAEGVAGRDVALRDAIERPALEFPGHGHRRVTKALRREGLGVNRRRVPRAMHRGPLLCQLRRRFAATPGSAHARRTGPDLLAAATLAGPDRARVAGIASIRLPTAFAYPAGLPAARSRRRVGWRLSRALGARLALAALDRALALRRPAAGPLHRPDRGVRDAGGDDVARLESAGARISMAATGTPYEHAKKALTREGVYREDYRSFAEAEVNLGRFIEEAYNARRLHSGLGYPPPAESEAAHATIGGS
ncbi:MAG TPA: IS3 family transposase [Thermomicrobiales bacterium]|nr:IS3 family transposase [Thermomicrobiales bacterium]